MSAVLLVAAGAIFAGFGVGADRADAAYLAQVKDRVLTVKGDAASDKVSVRLKSGAPERLQVDVGDDGSADFNFKREKFDAIAVSAGGGDDLVLIDEDNGAFGDTEPTTLDGQDGNDTLQAGSFAETLEGGTGDDVLIGGDGTDTVDGNQGDDVALLGAGNDRFRWDPGDGSDAVEGEAGTDTMLFNGNGANEIVEASANGERLRFTRNVGNIVMDANDVEVVDLNALGGTDTITAGDLSGTDLVELNGDLAGTLGGTAGDAQPDTVIVNGTNGDDTVDVVGAGTSASVVGLATQVNIANSEGGNDALVINALGGTDGVTATTLPAGVVKPTIDGGGGDDDILGSQGADVFLGGDGDDFVVGDNGNDVALMGAGDDVFQWDPGDGNDTLEGQDGADTMLFFGSNASENVDISANGGRVRFFRDVAAVTMDLDDVEDIDFRALGGADDIVVGDLSGTDVTQNGVDLRGSGGGGDGQADTITVNGSRDDDVFGAAGGAGGINVFGLQATVNVFSPEQANDRLTLNALGGADVVDATPLAADGIQLAMNGGLGADVFLGSEGDDLINGGDGDDLALMGAADDTFVWNPGDDNDTLEGQAGNDTMLFNGNNASENIDVSANGRRLRFFRDVAAVTMDLNDLEVVDYRAFGGADVIIVNDLSGTDVTDVKTDLAAVGGAGDARADSVVVHGTNGDDVALAAGDASGVSVIGLAAQVTITGAEAANDSLSINALDGDDVVEASGLAASAIRLLADGGAGDDVLIGGARDDVLTGGTDDDVLIGGPGQDILDGGPGTNTVIQD